MELQDQNGLVLNTFASISDCAKFLGVSRSTAARRLWNSEPVPSAILVDTKWIYIKKVENNSL